VPAFCYYNKYLRQTKLREKVDLGSEFWRFQYKIDHCFGPGVWQYIMAGTQGKKACELLAVVRKQWRICSFLKLPLLGLGGWGNKWRGGPGNGHHGAVGGSPSVTVVAKETQAP
jgi:hypothetical protein